jgi:Tfp pilus assembly protein PilN
VSRPPTSSPPGSPPTSSPPASPASPASSARNAPAGQQVAAPPGPPPPTGPGAHHHAPVLHDALSPRHPAGEPSLASQALSRAGGGPAAPEGPLTPAAPAIPSPAAASSAVPTAPHERSGLNLARRPFVNSRPVKRLAILLWVLGGLLLAGNVSLFWRYLGSSEQTRAALARAERKTAAERREVGALAGRIAGMDLDQQNHEVAYLNRKIAERTFSWSLLFDRLAEVLPDGVRLNQLSPQGPAEKEQQPSRSGPIANADKNTPVLVQILGEAKNDEALLLFVKRLFEHPSFADPDLGHEERVESGLLKFELKVKYLPGGNGSQVPP